MIKKEVFLSCALVSSFVICSSVQAKLTTKELVFALQTNPKSVMDLVPEKVYPKNYKGPHARFTKKDILSGAYAKIRHEDKINGRDHMKVVVIDPVTKKKSIMKIGQNLHGRAPIAYNDSPANLVDNGYSLVSNLVTMEQRNLKRAKLKESPWSDYYWPIRSGVLGYRYADSDFPQSRSTSWQSFKNWIENNPVSNYDGDDLRLASPSEKYDILVGGRNGAQNLTRRMWAQGSGYGDVEWWMGICHGWAPAAYSMDRPTHSIEVKAVDGTKILFYPSDLKALGSLLWAEQSPPTRFIGGRCNLKESNIRKDSNGRIIDQDCFDTNPGSWHQAIVNQIGVSNRSFVMDATFDYEVWNQPVYSYSYNYFNVESGDEHSSVIDGGSLNTDVAVRLSDWSSDPFKKYRSPNAQYVVGVNMKVSYVVETMPSTVRTDSPDNDAITSVSYQYDLELDSNGNIIGGEWYNNRHPDFLWTPGPGDKALSPYDSNVSGSWYSPSTNALPDSWTVPAQRAAQSGHPLNTILEVLYRESSR